MPSRSPRRFSPGTLIATTAIGLLAACGGNTATPTANPNDILQAGLTAQTSGHLDEATADYKQVIQLDPHNQYAYYNLGVIAQGQTRNADAETEYRTALIIDPNFEQALFNLATLRAAVSPPFEAIELYYHILQIDPKYAEAHLNLGVALVAAGQAEEGRAEKARAVALKPSLGNPTPSPTP